MPEDYIIIRRTNSPDPSPIFRGSSGPSGAGELSIELEEAALSRSERHEMAEDPSVTMAPAMPMKLIEPVVPLQAVEEQDSDIAWGIEAVRAHTSPFDGTGITVAVLDTGIDRGHPAFSGMNIVQKNFTMGEDHDIDGHGTHCAGTIFGQNVEGQRIGVARGIERALIAKVLGEGGGSSAILANAILWSVQRGAHVISMSLGIDFPGAVNRWVNDFNMDINAATSRALEGYRENINLFTELSSLVNQLSNKTILVAASGNESDRPNYEIAVGPPAAGTGVISVGALRKTGAQYTIADFSNDKVNIAAPGQHILSARAGGGFTTLSGTSMATPHVAGVAALWAQRQLDVTGIVEQSLLRSQLVASGSFGSLKANWEVDDIGSGLVQAPV